MYEDIGLKITNDHLNFHDEATLYVLRKDSHYDILYKGGENFGVTNINGLVACDEKYNNNLSTIIKEQFEDMRKHYSDKKLMMM